MGVFKGGFFDSGPYQEGKLASMHLSTMNVESELR